MASNDLYLPDSLPPAVMRLGEGPSVTMMSQAEERHLRDFKAWRWCVRLVGEGWSVVTWWAVDGCERDDREKALMYLRKRALLEGVRRLEIYDFIRPVTVEILEEIAAFNRGMDLEKRKDVGVQSIGRQPDLGNGRTCEAARVSLVDRRAVSRPVRRLFGISA